MSGAWSARLSGAIGPGDLIQVVRPMEYHIMVFQTLRKHFAIPAIRRRWVSSLR
ncbi:hypothetical protein C4J86_2223 [Pseudomonas sp. R2-7-07]|nr:hypothetical protein C4J86_2223 [Pseudomonas sp. R2-7-07]